MSRAYSTSIFWLKDERLEDLENLPAPDVLTREIADNLESVLEQFKDVIGKVLLTI